MLAEASPLNTASTTASESTIRKLHSLRWLWLVLLAGSAYAQPCQSAGDMDASVRTALENAAKRYFDMAARGDATSLRQNSISAVASSFADIESSIKENQPA